MRRIFIVTLGLVHILFVWAMPAKMRWIQVRQSDSTVLTLRVCGDEHFHYYMTTDDIPVMQNEDNGNYYYANASGFGMTMTNQLAHNSEARSKGEQMQTSKLMSINDMSVVSNSTQRRRVAAAKQASFTGKKKGLVILTQFKDKKFSLSSAPKVLYDSITNCQNYKSGHFLGSVYDYFFAQSGGSFELNFDVVGPITLPNTSAYYGANDKNGDDLRPGEMVANACQIIADSVNFADYDWDGDGYVDQVFILYAGYGENDSDVKSTVWPHEWQLSFSDYGKSLTINGSIIDTYACGNELAYGTSTLQSSGIGTFCHEFSHCLGLPDDYDTTHNTNYGMDSWDLMDYGSYNGDGFCPPEYTSYEKWVCGWATPIVLSEPTDVTNQGAMSEGGNSYIIYNDNNSNEYYLLENRQQVNWDRCLSGAGLLVIHVDYSFDAWTDNTINTDNSHQRMTIFHADNIVSRNLTSVKSDPYPYLLNDSLTNNSIPAATLFNVNTDGKKYMNKPITKITQNSDGTISFKFMGGTSAGIVSIQSDDRLLGKPVTVYDVNGKKVKYIPSYAGTLDISIPGIYILRGNSGITYKYKIK